jgi:hypothetical protein
MCTLHHFTTQYMCILYHGRCIQKLCQTTHQLTYICIYIYNWVRPRGITTIVSTIGSDVNIIGFTTSFLLGIFPLELLIQNRIQEPDRAKKGSKMKVLRIRRNQFHCVCLVFLIPAIYLLRQTAPYAKDIAF